MKSTLAIVLVAISLEVCAQKPPPHTPPTTAAKGGGVQKLDSRKEANGIQSNTSNSQPVTFAVECPNGCAIDEKKGKSDKEIADAASLDRLTRRYMCFTIIGVVGGWIGVILIFWQSILLRRSADAALLTAQAVINIERPWVIVDYERSSDGSFYNFQYRNHGKTPAEIVSHWEHFDFYDDFKDLRIPPEYGEGGVELNKLLIPDGKPVTFYPFFPVQAIKNLPPGDKRKLIIYGIVRYYDVLNRIDPPHETRYRYWFNPGAQYSQGDLSLDGPQEYHGHT